MSEPDYVSIRGAREHNLKNVDIDIPKKKLVIFTGVSGSGKSSLAFDTLYAEGQRRYVESLSAYARQFLGQMEKPKYDSIRGLSPAISIEQKTASSNPRSTVGTVTEIHDYLRVLYANLGMQHCTTCGRKVGKQSAQQIVDEILRLPAGSKIQILAPLAQNKKGEFKDVLADAQKRGFARIRINGAIRGLDEKITLDKKSKHNLDLVIDRIIVKAEVRPRLTDSVETALREGKGMLAITDESGAPEKDRIFSEQNACHHCGLSFPELTPAAFSFNNPVGMCQPCSGLGTKPEMDPDLIVVDPTKSIRDGAVEVWASAMAKGEGWTADLIEYLSKEYGFSIDTPWNKLSPKAREVIMTGERGDGKRRRYEWEGLVHKLMRGFKATTSDAMKEWYMRFLSDKPCPECQGERLRAESRAVKVGEVSLPTLCRKSISEAHGFIEGLHLEGSDAQIASELLKEIGNRLRFLVNVGLTYLTLERSAATLSGGESQRIRLASQLGSDLTGVIYILDEPSIGLHQRDNTRLINTLKHLRDLGNTVLVVEHDEETMMASDYVFDFGPGAGSLGGSVVAKGTPDELIKDPNSLTGAYLSGREKIAVPPQRRSVGKEKLRIEGATANNLKNLSVDIPLGGLIAVTGVSGAGKSTLINEILLPSLERELHQSRVQPAAHKSLTGLKFLDKVIAIDQKPIGRTPRSNPATYTKLFDPIRNVLAQTPEARTYGYEPGRFSFNVKGGRCEACEGDGVKKVEMHFLADVFVTCEICNGKRYNDATLRVHYKGKNIADILDMPVREAMTHFEVHKDIMRVLKTLDEVGLSYIKIGQPSPTLSGGEAQRIKLSRELARVSTGRTLYVLDEPTTGLHFEDIRKLLAVLNRLVDAGNTVLVIEHNLDVIKCADWVIDLGPEGGAGGGELLAVGTPEEVARIERSHTGKYLKPLLKAGRAAA